MLQESTALLVGSAFLLSLLVGSFLNVVIHRLPIMLDRQWRTQANDPQMPVLRKLQTRATHSGSLITGTGGRLPAGSVIGTGTMLDSARLRQVLGRELDLDPRSIHGQVVGEHGASEVVLWSGGRVGGRSLGRWPGWDEARRQRVTEEVRTAGQEVIRRKGATTHAIGLVTATLLKWMLRGARRVLTVSRVQDGALGLTGVALSLPTVLGPAGAVQVFEPDMTDAEREEVLRSAEVLRQAALGLPD
mgnify:CR=1 FL=1